MVTPVQDQIMMLLMMYWVSSASPDQNTWDVLNNQTAVKEQNIPAYDIFLNDVCYPHQRMKQVVFCYCLRESQNECIRTGATNWRVGR